MNKEEKLRAIIKLEIEVEFIGNIQKELNKNARWARKLMANPKFLERKIEEATSFQVGIYMTLSDEAVDAAYHFFIERAAGEEWRQMARKFNREMMFDWSPKFATKLMEELIALP